VAPPVIDRWGPGTRVPLIVVSKFAKQGYVDHTEYETASILALIEKRFNLKPLGTRDAAANPFSNAFQF
jgi:phospholipase C